MQTNHFVAILCARDLHSNANKLRYEHYAEIMRRKEACSQRLQFLEEKKIEIECLNVFTLFRFCRMRAAYERENTSKSISNYTGDLYYSVFH